MPRPTNLYARLQGNSMSGDRTSRGPKGGRKDRLPLSPPAVLFRSAPWTGLESVEGVCRGPLRPRSLQALERTTGEHVRAGVPGGFRCMPRPCPRRGWTARSGRRADRVEVPVALFPRRGTRRPRGLGAAAPPRLPVVHHRRDRASGAVRRAIQDGSQGGRPGECAHSLGRGAARGNDPTVHRDGHHGHLPSQRGTGGAHR